jgi:valyl-tRNA synthetase
MTIDKSYNPHDIEARWYKHWEDRGYFAPSQADGEPYCIMIPPPNVTGSLHMGHAFQDTIMDALIRFNRMKGRNTLWQPGMDHAGIATQMVVERLINAEGKTRHDYGREKFIEKVWDWKAESGGTITQQLRRMGASPDWDNERFTMDEGLNKAVNEVFVSLYDEGIIYRGKRLVNWDPVLHTALSDLEVLSEEEKGFLWHLKYPLCDSELSDSDSFLIVATTRPETMLGDTAVAVHPDDERYQDLVGRYCELPLTGRKIPIIADDYVDPEFGSGCVKITPAHDFNDYQVWVRHRHSAEMTNQIHGGLINVFNDDASIRDNQNNNDLEEGQLIPSAYVGLDRIQARKNIVADFEALGLLERIDDHRLMIPRGDRSGAVVEPYLTDQWYVDLTRDVQDDGRPGGKAVITDPSIDAVRSGKIEFVPESWSKTYYQWLENIEDWCISRQIWWGHRIPAWYDDDDNVYVGHDEQQVRNKYFLDSGVSLRQDDDVLDTWFSSALWPFSTLGWPEQTERLKTFYPTSVLVTGFDIIFFWVARMIMMGTKFMGEVPFSQVYIHGLVRDAHGQKMSKSKGNVLDPIDLIDGIDLDALVSKRVKGMMQPHLEEKIAKLTRKDFPDGIPGFGTDALRFTFAALASNGRDINFDLGRIEGYRNFCNKIWNAARFVQMNTEGMDCGQCEYQSNQRVELSSADRWMISRLQKSELKIEEAIVRYRFDHAAQEIYDLTWNYYCDWYLELSKTVLSNPDSPEALQIGTRRTLLRVLETILRLAHPIMPFITEDIWQRISEQAGKSGETIMTQPYPESDPDKIDELAEIEIEWVMAFILGVRKIRGEMDISPGKRVPVLIADASADDLAKLAANRSFLDVVGKIESIDVLDQGQEQPEAAITMLGNMKLLIPMAGLIDKGAELARLGKQALQIEAEIQRVSKKLGNSGFVEKAPAVVVQKEQQKLDDYRVQKSGIEQQIEKISAL